MVEENGAWVRQGEGTHSGVPSTVGESEPIEEAHSVKQTTCFMNALLDIERERHTLVDAAGLCAGRGCASDAGCLLQPNLNGRQHGADRLLCRGVVNVHGMRLRHDASTHARLDGEVERNLSHLMAQIGAVGSYYDRAKFEDAGR